MRIVITGALGHIGSAFIANIKPHEYESVLLIDNLSAQRYCSLFNLPKGVQFTFVEADVCTADLETLFKGYDIIVHLAAITNAEASIGQEKEVEQVNFYGTKRVAEACLKMGAKLIFPSSTSVYGSQLEVVDEKCSMKDLKPQSPYAEYKLKAEQYLQNTMKKRGLKFTIFRFGTIFGTSPGMRFHTAVNKFVWQACMSIPLTVWQTALHQKRPYLSIKDAISAIRFMIQKNYFKGEIYNVLTLNATVSEIIDTIKILIPNLTINLVESPIMNHLSYTVNDQKIKKLGFKSLGNLEEDITNSILLFKPDLRRSNHLVYFKEKFQRFITASSKSLVMNAG